MSKNERVTFLLGAGASVEAKVPASVDLTRTIAERLDNPMNRYSGASQALHVAIGAMIAHDTSRGAGAYAGVDVERLFAAIRQMAQRDELDISAFVTAWNPHLDGLGSRGSLPPFWAKNFKKEMAGKFDSHLEKQFIEGVNAVTGGVGASSVFAELERQMIRILTEALFVEPSNVDYLRPLMSGTAPSIRIATLNYDRSIEILAERASMSLDTGVTQWSGGYGWEWDKAAKVRLLKLHGSLDWYLERTKSDGEVMRSDKVTLGNSGEQDAYSRGSLAVVFGHGAKLRSDGPFLAMLHEFDRFLSETDRLVIIGYSMRDTHINDAIRRWMNATPEARISIIDPAFPQNPWSEEYGSFRREFISAIFTEERDSKPKPGHDIIRKGAGAGLKELLGEGPLLAPV